VTDAGWRLEERDGLLVALCDALSQVPWASHAFSTRRGDGGHDFDLGSPGPVDDVVHARRRRLIAAADVESASPLILHQVHGATVVRAADASDGTPADGAVWARAEPPSRAPSVRTADCVPILIVDRTGAAAAAVHAGWRGTAGGISARAVEAMAEAGARPRDLVAALGPAILPCCYEVEGEVHEKVAMACGGDRGLEGLGRPSGRRGRVRLDLHAANRLQLLRAGLGSDDIHAAPWCTRCHGELFFSFRRDGRAAGRQMAVVGARRGGGGGRRP
jgi:YfiH family protein